MWCSAIIPIFEHVQGNFPVDNCCGSYPHRFPYSSLAGKSCCSGKTFNVNAFECCEGNVETIGTCSYDPCYPNPCQYGICSGLSNQGSAQNFHCSCDTGWTGEICDQPDCQISCQNGGAAEYGNGYCQCVCPPGFTGTHCELDPCDNVYCQNGATPMIMQGLGGKKINTISSEISAGFYQILRRRLVH